LQGLRIRQHRIRSDK